MIFVRAAVQDLHFSCPDTDARYRSRIPLNEFFREGIGWEICLRCFRCCARDTLNAFITLFRGGDDEVMVRLMVLREIGAVPTRLEFGAPRTTPSLPISTRPS